MVCLSKFKLFKGCLPHILLGLFFNTLSHIMYLVKTYEDSENLERRKPNEGFCMMFEEKLLKNPQKSSRSYITDF